MALVLSPRAPADSASAAVLAPRHGALRGLALCAPIAAALALVAESAACALPAVLWLEPAGFAVTGCATLLALGVCVAAWLGRRDDGGLLLAATLAPVLFA